MNCTHSSNLIGKNIVRCLCNFLPQSTAYPTFLHKKPNPTQIKEEFEYLRVVKSHRGHIFCIKTCLLEVLFLLK